MKLIRLRSEIDFNGWRQAARALIGEGIAPENVAWVVGETATLLGENELGHCDSSDSAPQFTVPRAFLALAQSAILHSEASRFALLYRLLWRLQHETGLMNVASDPDVTRARAMSQAVAREIHKTHAFVRFRTLTTHGEPVYVAWFEPTHHTLEAAAPFFVRRFASMKWSMLTPRVCAFWDGNELRFGLGANRADAPNDDALEALWRTYYASIFNPARLKTKTMQAHMPRKYWAHLPEAELIGELIVRAPEVTHALIEHGPTQPRLRAPPRSMVLAEPQSDTLEGVRRQALGCTACPLFANATQTVFGAGSVTASVMFIGEQPGDQEDLLGRPFVGPAGQLFDRALREAQIDRAQVYVTNAVKHFKFEPRGKRRLHKTPAQREIEACRPWLEREIRMVRPRLIVALGATAANSLFNRPTPMQRNRGRLMPIADGAQALITVHPSYLLRVPAEQHPHEYRRFVDDLRLVLPFTTQAIREDTTASSDSA
jgi:DNA polymerase